MESTSYYKRCKAYKDHGITKGMDHVIINNVNYPVDVFDGRRTFTSRRRMPSWVQRIAGHTYAAWPIRYYDWSDCGIPEKFPPVYKGRGLTRVSTFDVSYDQTAYPHPDYWMWKRGKLVEGIKEFTFWDLFDYLNVERLLEKLPDAYTDRLYPDLTAVLLGSFLWDDTEYWYQQYELLREIENDRKVISKKIPKVC